MSCTRLLTVLLLLSSSTATLRIGPRPFATLLLPAWKRPYVHALYGFARYADEIVDDLGSTLSDAEKADWLVGWGEQFVRDVEAGGSDHPISRAVVDTVRR